MSKLERINSFVAVVEQRGFASAARKLGQSTAAISRHIASLEAELKAQLLQRTTRQLTLTEVGEQYYRHCKNALNELNIAEAAITGSKTEATGVLTILSARYFALQFILPRLPEFMAANPALQIKLELAERVPNFTQEGVDLLIGVVGSLMEQESDLVQRQITTTRYVLCASPGYLKEHGIPNTAADLKKHQYITHSMRKPDNVIKFKDNTEICLQPILALNDSQAMRECALQGMGIVNLHDYMVKDFIEKKQLVEILPSLQKAQHPIYLYYQYNRYLQPKIRRFIDFYWQ